MKAFLLVVLCFVAVHAVEEIETGDEALGNISAELLEDAVKYDVDDETLSIWEGISTGRPFCILNREGKFRHISPFRYWVCTGFMRAESRRCPALRMFLQSAGRCVWAWNWRPDGIEAPLSWCERPSCEGLMRHFLQPTTSPTHFYQCAPYGVVKMPCAPGTKFSFLAQRCVWPSQWRNPC